MAIEDWGDYATHKWTSYNSNGGNQEMYTISIQTIYPVTNYIYKVSYSKMYDNTNYELSMLR